MWLLLFAALSLWAEEDAIERHAAAASAAMQAGDYAAAEKHNRAIVRLAPEVAEAQTNLGLSCFLQKKYEEAVQAFESGLKRKPEMANAWLFLGIARFHLNRPSQAVPALQRYTALRPQDFQGHYFLGLSLLSLESYEESGKSLLVARRIDPRNIDALYHLAQSYLGQARVKSRSRDILRASYEATVKEIAAIDPQSYRIAQLRAGYFEALGEKKKAIDELERLLQSDPKVRGLHYTLGCLYTESRLYDRALDQFQSELRLDAPYPRTYLQLGHVYLALEQPGEALQALQRSLAIDPESAGAVWIDLGRAYNMMDQPSKAAAAFENAIELGERKASVYYQLAMAFRKAGKLEQSREALTMSQKLRDAESRAR